MTNSSAVYLCVFNWLRPKASYVRFFYSMKNKHQPDTGHPRKVKYWDGRIIFIVTEAFIKAGTRQRKACVHQHCMQHYWRVLSGESGRVRNKIIRI